MKEICGPDCQYYLPDPKASKKGNCQLLLESAPISDQFVVSKETSRYNSRYGPSRNPSRVMRGEPCSTSITPRREIHGYVFYGESVPGFTARPFLQRLGILSQ